MARATAVRGAVSAFPQPSPALQVQATVGVPSVALRGAIGLCHPFPSLVMSTNRGSANGLLRKRTQRPFGGPPPDLVVQCLEPSRPTRVVLGEHVARQDKRDDA
jgi:hypothetical protein